MNNVRDLQSRPIVQEQGNAELDIVSLENWHTAYGTEFLRGAQQSDRMCLSKKGTFLPWRYTMFLVPNRRLQTISKDHKIDHVYHHIS